MPFIRFSVIFVLICCAGGTAYGQIGAFMGQLLKNEAGFESRVQEEHRNYRLIRMVTAFPERINATGTVQVSSDPPGATAALHELRNGEPLEACKTPCELHVSPSRKYMIVLYKFGHQPRPVFTPGTAEERHAWLGINYLEVLGKQKKCRKEFKSEPLIDSKALPCVRVPPVIPNQAEKSGHCKMIFDVNEKGRPHNIRTRTCTETIFEKPSKASIHWWFYHPKVERGQAVTQTDVTTKVSFRLSDEEGNLIPE